MLANLCFLGVAKCCLRASLMIRSASSVQGIFVEWQLEVGGYLGYGCLGRGRWHGERVDGVTVLTFGCWLFGFGCLEWKYVVTKFQDGTVEVLRMEKGR